MTKWNLPEGRKPVTDADMADTAPSPAGVTIKPLVWEYHPAGAIAAPPTGHAYIIDTRMKGRVYSLKGFNPAREFGSMDEAKAAAQADYEARIMAAMEPAPCDCGSTQKSSFDNSCADCGGELYQAAKRDAEEAEAYAAALEAALKLHQDLDVISVAAVNSLTAQLAQALEALELADAALSGANMNMRAVEKKVKATIAELKGDQ
jgi:hypothetical protein